MESMRIGRFKQYAASCTAVAAAGATAETAAERDMMLRCEENGTLRFSLFLN